MAQLEPVRPPNARHPSLLIWHAVDEVNGRMRIALGLALLGGCAPLYVVTNHDHPVPPGVWTTRPVPCGYEEVSQLHIEVFDRSLLLPQIEGRLAREDADALIDGRWWSSEVRVPVEQCVELGCEPIEGAISVNIEVYRFQALAIRWLPETCDGWGSD